MVTTRKGKHDPQRIRGGKSSPAWGEPTAWLNAKAPPLAIKTAKMLAAGHNLHIWQVLVEGLDCFVTIHGPHTPPQPTQDDLKKAARKPRIRS